MRLRPASEDRDHCVEIYTVKETGRFVEKEKPPPNDAQSEGEAGNQDLRRMCTVKNTVHPARIGFAMALLCAVCLGPILSCFAVEPEPRKWNYLPLGANFAGVGYVYTEAEHRHTKTVSGKGCWMVLLRRLQGVVGPIHSCVLQLTWLVRRL